MSTNQVTVHKVKGMEGSGLVQVQPVLSMVSSRVDPLQPSTVSWTEHDTGSSKIHMLKPESSLPQNVTVFGDGAFKEAIKLK